MLTVLEEPITLSILGGLISLLILYIHNKLSKKKMIKLNT